MAWRFRSCPHCGGDTFLVKDIDDIWVENCLQCGYEADKNKRNEKLQIVKPLKRRSVRQLARLRLGS
jgi:Zn ribbon nucleic-acid-binding protein